MTIESETSVPELKSLGSEFVGKEVELFYEYSYGYRPREITMQVSLLRELFPGIGSADEWVASQPVPRSAECLFAIPRWEAIAREYAEALKKVLALISKTRRGKFYSWWPEDRLAPDWFRQQERTVMMFNKLGEQQKGHDIIIIPAQLGLSHAGRSIPRARSMFRENEFGLGAFTVGIILLTHPERLVNHEDLWADCAGDEVSPEADGDFSDVPVFNFNGKRRNGRAEFDIRWGDEAFEESGSASGFLFS